MEEKLTDKNAGIRFLYKAMVKNKMADASQKSHDVKGDLNKTSTEIAVQDPKNLQDLTQYVQNLLQQMQDKFQVMSDQILARIDDMGHRIDDLEKNIGELMTQAGIEEGEK